MDAEKKAAPGIVDAARRMFEIYKELIPLQAIEYGSLGASWSSLGMVMLILAVFVLLFAGLGAAWWLGEAMNNIKAGFFIVCGFYLVLVVAIALTANKMIIPGLRNLFIRKMYGKNN
jgi:hypothetical protein